MVEHNAANTNLVVKVACAPGYSSPLPPSRDLQGHVKKRQPSPHERFRREPLWGGSIGSASVANASTKSRTLAGRFSRLG
jgi:hypothetical protein